MGPDQFPAQMADTCCRPETCRASVAALPQVDVHVVGPVAKPVDRSFTQMQEVVARFSAVRLGRLNGRLDLLEFLLRPERLVLGIGPIEHLCSLLSGRRAPRVEVTSLDGTFILLVSTGRLVGILLIVTHKTRGQDENIHSAEQRHSDAGRFLCANRFQNVPVRVLEKNLSSRVGKLVSGHNLDVLPKLYCVTERGMLAAGETSLFQG